MSLQVDAREVKEYDPTSKEDQILLTTLAQACLIVGISEISDKTWKETYLRIHFMEKLLGAYRTQATENGLVDVLVTPEEVQRFTGLRTNVTYIERSKFLRMSEQIMNSWLNTLT